jgi:hypothetical protein
MIVRATSWFTIAAVEPQPGDDTGGDDERRLGCTAGMNEHTGNDQRSHHQPETVARKVFAIEEPHERARDERDRNGEERPDGVHHCGRH